MKNRFEFLRIMMLLTLPLCFSTGVVAQSTRNPQKDLFVSFSSKYEENDPGSVFGVVKNNSINTYPCVRLEFNLSTRFDQRRPGERSQHLGVLPVELQNIGPRTVREYQARLPYPAGIGLKSVTECAGNPPKVMPDPPEILSFTVAPPSIQAGQTATLEWRTANTDRVFVGMHNPEWPQASSDPIREPRDLQLSGSLQVSPSQTATYRLEAKKQGRSVIKDVTIEVTPAPPATCSITGSILGQLQWHQTDDRGQPVLATLTHVSMRAPGVAQPLRARIQGRTYTFENVPAGQTYRIYPSNFGSFGGKFRSRPGEGTVLCRPNRAYRQNFEITGPPPID